MVGSDAGGVSSVVAEASQRQDTVHSIQSLEVDGGGQGEGKSRRIRNGNGSGSGGEQGRK